MSKRRIDVETLVHVFEKRLNEIEKNPPELVPQSVIIKMLERAVREEIENHFTYLIKKELIQSIHEEFKKLRVSFVKNTIKGMLSDEMFRQSLENRLKKSIISGIDTRD